MYFNLRIQSIFLYLYIHISVFKTVNSEQVLSSASDFQSEELSNANINKCTCQSNQALQDGLCVNGTLNKIEIWDEKEQNVFLVEITKFATVTIKNVICEEGYSKLNLRFDQFLIHTTGLLDNLVLIEEQPTDSYCIEHLQTPAGVTVIAEYCEKNPKIPLCCPASHILNTDGECVYKQDLLFHPPLIGQFNWSGYDLSEQKLACKEDEALFTFTIDAPDTDLAAAMVGHPLGSIMEARTDFEPGYEVRMFEDYCVSVTESTEEGKDLSYSAKFCRMDLKREFESKCKNRTCIRKCCPEGNIALVISDQSHHYQCVPNDSFSANLTFFNEEGNGIFDSSNITVKYGSPFCEEFYVKNMDNSNSAAKKRINSKGDFIINNVVQYHPADYCIDLFAYDYLDGKLTESVAFCIKEKVEQCSWRWIVGSVLLAVSCIFYLLTLIVYVTIKELRSKMVGRCLISQVSALFIAYITLIFLQNINSDHILLCHLPGTIEHFAILASFFWLNVMCFDVWRNISLFRRADVKGDDVTLRFLYYSLYAWGSPLLIGLIRIVVDEIPVGDHGWLIKANFGDTHCFFANDYSVPAKWLYLYGPILVILLVNTGFFSHVAAILITQKRNSKLLMGPDSAQTGRKLSDRKERFIMYLKLFLVMGLSWILEIVMWLSVPESDCYFWGFDIVNAFQGVFIFIIFVCKDSIMKQVKEKFSLKSFKVIHVKGKYDLPENQSQLESPNTQSSNSTEQTSVTDHL